MRDARAPLGVFALGVEDCDSRVLLLSFGIRPRIERDQGRGRARGVSLRFQRRELELAVFEHDHDGVGFDGCAGAYRDSCDAGRGDGAQPLNALGDERSLNGHLEE